MFYNWEIFPSSQRSKHKNNVINKKRNTIWDYSNNIIFHRDKDNALARSEFILINDKALKKDVNETGKYKKSSGFKIAKKHFFITVLYYLETSILYSSRSSCQITVGLW